VRGDSIQFQQNPLQYGFSLLQHIIIPKAQHPQVAFRQKGVAFFVRLLCQLIGMLAAIQLYDQSCVDADKIDDIFCNGMLPAKFPACHSTIPQKMPHPGFGIGRSLAHFPGEGLQEFGMVFLRAAFSLFFTRPLTPTLSPKGRGSVHDFVLDVEIHLAT
jgi:hypothetical protein